MKDLTPISRGFFSALVKTAAGPPGLLSRWGRRAAIGGALMAPVVGTAYGFGRGLKAGQKDLENRDRKDAQRAAMLSGGVRM